MIAAFATYLILQATIFALAGFEYWKDCIRLTNQSRTDEKGK